VTSTNGGTGTTATATLTVSAISTVTAVSVGAETPGNVGPGQSATYAITTTWTGHDQLDASRRRDGCVQSYDRIEQQHVNNPDHFQHWFDADRIN
jgi:hypothetical protein